MICYEILEVFVFFSYVLSLVVVESFWIVVYLVNMKRIRVLFLSKSIFVNQWDFVVDIQLCISISWNGIVYIYNL